MSTFDRKEDVLSIELTKHGRSLLSKGLLNPTYYAFFDDDVLYDGEYAGLSESQSDIEPRINDMIRLLPQASYIGVDQTVNHLSLHPRDLHPFGAPLGTAESRAEYMPAWHIRTHLGAFTSASAGLSNAPVSASMPQLEFEIEFKTKIGKRDPFDLEDEGPPGHDLEGQEGSSYLFNFESQSFPDGSFVKIEGEPLLLEIIEEHAPLLKENFEIEAFWVDESGTEEELRPLNFGSDRKLNATDAEFFIDLLCDDEIEDRFLCEVGDNRNRTNIFLPHRLDCRKFPPFEGDNEPLYIPQGSDDGDIC